MSLSASRELRLPPFVVSKLINQAKKRSWTWLQQVYELIGQIDDALKNGKLEPEAGMELLVYNLAKAHADRDMLIKIA